MEKLFCDEDQPILFDQLVGALWVEDGLDSFIIETGRADDVDENCGYSITEFTFDGRILYAYTEIRYNGAGDVDCSWVEFFTSDAEEARTYARDNGYRSKWWLRKNMAGGCNMDNCLWWINLRKRDGLIITCRCSFSRKDFISRFNEIKKLKREIEIAFNTICYISVDHRTK
jgi:hypothetical protein